jgi:NTE family protein
MQWLSLMSVDELADAPVSTTHDQPARGDLAIMLTGGGARAAYQVGLLKGIARYFPSLRFQVITGVSAGAINAIFLAAAEGSLNDRVARLADLWRTLECHHVFNFDFRALLPFRSALASIMPRRRWARPHGLLDTTPLSDLLCRVLNTEGRSDAIGGVQRNIKSGDLNALSLITLDYSTGQSVRWVQGRYGDTFDGPNRRSAHADLTVDHVMASAALPFVFPAVRIGNQWYGDGGIRLAAPLSSAVHLGATRILAMSTGYQRTPEEAAHLIVRGYPPTAQILSQLVNAIFLDVIDEDVARMERMNDMIRKMPVDDRNGFRAIDLFVMRPSVDLGVLAVSYEKYLPAKLKLITRAMGAKEAESSDFVSMLMFEPHYTKLLVEIGEQDVESRLDELRAFFAEDVRQNIAAV